MKACQNCGTEAFNSTKTCRICGTDFGFQSVETDNSKELGNSGEDASTNSFGAPSFSTSSTPAAPARPDGSTMIPLGAWMLGGGVIALFAGLIIDTRDYAGVDFEKLALQWNLLIGGGGLAQLGLLLLLTGYILRAISFLPGRES